MLDLVTSASAALLLLHLLTCVNSFHVVRSRVVIVDSLMSIKVSWFQRGLTRQAPSLCHVSRLVSMALQRPIDLGDPKPWPGISVFQPRCRLSGFKPSRAGSPRMCRNFEGVRVPTPRPLLRSRWRRSKGREDNTVTPWPFRGRTSVRIHLLCRFLRAACLGGGPCGERPSDAKLVEPSSREASHTLTATSSYSPPTWKASSP